LIPQKSFNNIIPSTSIYLSPNMYVPGGMQELIKIHSLKKYIIPSEDEQDPMEMYQSYI
jgi:hypothetical protein